MQDGWSERGAAFLPRLESDPHHSQFAKMVGLAKGSTHPTGYRIMREFRDDPVGFVEAAIAE
jgi:hypothetical protein